MTLLARLKTGSQRTAGSDIATAPEVEPCQDAYGAKQEAAASAGREGSRLIVGQRGSDLRTTCKTMSS